MKLNVIGLGKISSKIAKQLYDPDDCFLTEISTNICSSNVIEDNEQQYDKFKKNIEIHNIDEISETYIFVDGKQGISGITLSILENYKDKKITVFYIKSYCSNDIEFKNSHITINILQEYARSGMFAAIFLIDYDYVTNYIVNEIPDDNIIGFSEIENLFIDKLLFGVYIYHRLCNESYLDGEKINFEDTIYRTKTFFDIKGDSVEPYYNLQYSDNLIFVKGVRNQITKKEIIELQNFKNKIRKENNICVFLDSDKEFSIGISESKIIQESNYI